MDTLYVVVDKYNHSEFHINGTEQECKDYIKHSPYSNTLIYIKSVADINIKIIKSRIGNKTLNQLISFNQ